MENRKLWSKCSKDLNNQQTSSVESSEWVFPWRDMLNILGPRWKHSFIVLWVSTPQRHILNIVRPRGKHSSIVLWVSPPQRDTLNITGIRWKQPSSTVLCCGAVPEQHSKPCHFNARRAALQNQSVLSVVSFLRDSVKPSPCPDRLCRLPSVTICLCGGKEGNNASACCNYLPACLDATEKKSIKGIHSYFQDKWPVLGTFLSHTGRHISDWQGL